MKRLKFLCIGIAAFVVPLIVSCNVTRTITTSSQHVKRGDTTLIIQTKTVESYDARKNAIN